MPRVIRRIDDALAAGERAFTVGLLGLMVSAVFLDALHRIFAAEQGRSARLLAALLPAGLAGAAGDVVAPVLLGVAAVAVAYAALRTRAVASSRRRHLALAAVIAAGLAGATQALLRLAPNGLVWSQQMGLCFLLWVGLCGASLGARDRAHIAFELAGRLWPGRLRLPAEWLARLCSAAFSLFLAVLAAGFAIEHYGEWAESGRAAGLFEAFRVPRFVIYGFLPFPLSVMAFRFMVYGVRAAGHAAPPREEEPR
jgi:TRAP-type C4-dicarboxylate transport system permease small subunit